MGLSNGKCSSKARLDNKTVIVTGANTGIGKETIKDFYQRGGRVIAACRNLEKANEAIADIKKQCSKETNLGELIVSELDLSSLTSVKNFAESVLESEERVDILVNNAGVMMCPPSKTADGFELQIGTNHLGHFYLTLLLLPKIMQSTPARIVNVSSIAHTRGHIDFDDLNWTKRKYNSMGAYAQSKLANILFTKELAKRLEEANIKVTSYALHPGVIKTDLYRHLDAVYFKGLQWLWNNFVGFFIKNSEEGAQTTIYCAVDEKCGNENGLYYADCARTKPSKLAQNSEDAERLWNLSLELVGLGEDFDPFKCL